MNDMVEKAAVRDRLVKSAMNRLEKLAEESDEIVGQLRTTFSSVLFHGPELTAKATVAAPHNTLPGSELGQRMMRVAQQIEEDINQIHYMIDSADV